MKQNGMSDPSCMASMASTGLTDSFPLCPSLCFLKILEESKSTRPMNNNSNSNRGKSLLTTSTPDTGSNRSMCIVYVVVQWLRSFALVLVCRDRQVSPLLYIFAGQRHCYLRITSIIIIIAWAGRSASHQPRLLYSYVKI